MYVQQWLTRDYTIPLLKSQYTNLITKFYYKMLLSGRITHSSLRNGNFLSIISPRLYIVHWCPISQLGIPVVQREHPDVEHHVPIHALFWIACLGILVC